MPLTNRQRMLAVLQGGELDRVPFLQYSGLAAPDEEIWKLIGRANMGTLRWSRLHRCHTPHCDTVTEPFEREGQKGERGTLRTPVGTLTEEKLFDPALGSAAIRKHFVKTESDLRILLHYFRDMKVHEDFDTFARDDKLVGDDGLVMAWAERTAYQQLWIQWVSIEELALFMALQPDLMAELVAAMEQVHRAVFRVVRKGLDALSVPLISLPDNITAPMIGEARYRQYCMPMYQELADLIDGTGSRIAIHMDGDLKPLWSAIGESAIDCLDSFSPPPDNDTSPAAAVSKWPHMRLMLNFPSSVHLESEKVVYERAMSILNEAGHTGRLWIQISENVPPGAWKKSFPAIVKAVPDFGRPRRAGSARQ
jgi:hypothetical protein